MTHDVVPYRRRFLCAVPAILMLATNGSQAQESYPSKPTTLLVGFSAGGAVDLVARQLGQALGKNLGQPFVVENKAGATGTIAAEMAARAKPDGYTLLLGTQSTMVVAPNMYPKLRFDPNKDFAPISLIASVPLVLVQHPGNSLNK